MENVNNFYANNRKNKNNKHIHFFRMDMNMVRFGVELSELVYPGCDAPSPLVKVMTRGGGAIQKPFFVAFEGEGNLYISIRGMAEVSDFFFCAKFERAPLAGGCAHKGILEGARWIIEQLRSNIDNCTGKIICCGHSMGGATAGMICAVLTLEEKRENVFSISMAPFPILDHNLSSQLIGKSVSFVFRNDVVPRLDSKNLGLLIRTFIPPGATPQQVGIMLQPLIQQLISGFAMANGYDQNSMYNLSGEIPKIIEMLTNIASNQSQENEFELPGKAYYLDYKDGCPICQPYTDSQKMINIAGLLTGISDHSGELYQDVIFGIDELE